MSVANDAVGQRRGGFCGDRQRSLHVDFGAAGRAQSAKPLNAAAGTANEFPWDNVMAAAFGLLRLSPDAFWSMTPREFERAASTCCGVPALHAATISPS